MSKPPGKQKLKRRHHTVPKFYLSRFANERGQITRVPLPGDRSHLMATTDATVINDFYLVETDEGWSDAIEDAFGEVETDAAEAMRAAVDRRVWPLEEEHRRAIAMWAGLQYVRGPEVRQQQQEIADHALKLAIAVGGKSQIQRVLTKELGRTATTEEVDAEWERLTDFAAYKVSPHQNDHIAFIARLQPKVTSFFYSRAWGICHFERKTLLTGDTPLVTLRDPDTPPFYGTGLLNAGGFLIPLARRCALVIHAQQARDYVIDPSTSVARWVNQHVVFHARKTVFHHPDDHPLDGLEVPEQRRREMWISGEPQDFLMPDGYPKATVPPAAQP